MKRTCLFLLLVVALLWPHSNMAQGPLPVQVNAAAAKRYVSEYPSLASAFVFEANGTVKCTDQGVLSAFNRYEKHMVPSAANVSSLGAPNKTAAMDAGQTAPAETPMAMLENEITALERYLAGLSPDADSPMRDRYQQLLSERQRLNGKK